MASNSFGSSKRPAGKEHRDGTLGEAIDDLRRDIESGFTAIELNGLVQFRQTLTDAATADYDQIAPFDLTVVDVMVVKTELAAGANANTVQVKNIAAAISDAMSINGAADGDLVRMGTWDDATADVDKGVILRTTVTRVAGDAGVEVLITCRRR